MSIFDRSHRFAVWTQVQHPFKHNLSDFAYNNEALPGVTNVQSAMDYITNVLYPNTQANVPTPADLPAAGNSIGDYRVVDDDGDGRSAGYRWEQREGDAAPKWYKVFDVDWSTDAILAAVTDVTNDLYFYSKGKDDLDENGDPVTGLLAGQRVFGGASANTNLTLNANSGDGAGAQTGFVQIEGNFRPTADAIYDLSTATERWRDGHFSRNLLIDTMILGTGSITDITGQISFGDENLITTGNFSGAQVKGTSLVADNTTQSMTLVPGSISDSTGQISFGAVNLLTTGSLGAGVATFTDNSQSVVIDPDVTGVAQITSSTGTISFDNENLVTTGALTTGSFSTGLLNVDNIRIDGNTISSTDTNGNIELVPNGTGIIDLQKSLQALAATFTGNVGVTGQLNVDNLRLDGNTLSSTDSNGNVTITPDGTGLVQVDKTVIPGAANLDLGSSTNLFRNLLISGGVSNGTNSIAVGTLLSFRSGVFRDLAQTQPAQAGDSLFYDAANNVWLASTPDAEITHSTISGLTSGDAGHTQFVMLAGRTGGQVIQGGLNASENLVLESTFNATKGNILLRDNLTPETNASFTTVWAGTDLGDSTHYFRDIYSRGEFRGFRFENFTVATLPASSAQNIGRVVYATDNNKAYVDTGTQMKVLGVSKYVQDQVFDGTITQLDVDVSASIEDARLAQWQLMDNASDFETMYVTIRKTSATNVRIITNVPLPAGSYRLIGVE